MKVYVVYSNYDYEGCGIPEAAFSTEELAKNSEAFRQGFQPCVDELIVDQDIGA